MAVPDVKMCLLGEAGVGKSSLIQRYVQDKFMPMHPTIGAALQFKTITEGEKVRKYQIWDTAGQEKFRCLAPLYYRSADMAIIVYDITSKESFSTLKYWVTELNQRGPPNIIIGLAGNKCDLENLREVSYEEASSYADSLGAVFVETSAKNAVNVDALFMALHKKLPAEERPQISTQNLNSPGEQKVLGKCCA